MKIKKKKIWIGTSGWSYLHWRKIFYPENLSYHRWLEYYAQFFDTVELNASFYHLPSNKTFQNWAKKTPENFLFSVKASRFITHIKKLTNCKRAWHNFYKNAQGLGKKLGPILFQLPPSFKQNLKRLENFLKILPQKEKYAFEFRHQSWFEKNTFLLLKKYKVALCIAHSPRFPLSLEKTASFVYLRFHGGQTLYGSKYPEKELKEWAQKINHWPKKEIFIYFNNDFHGYAVQNAKTLMKFLKIKLYGKI